MKTSRRGGVAVAAVSTATVDAVVVRTIHVALFSELKNSVDLVIAQSARTEHTLPSHLKLSAC
jgi:hypothetical protein